MNKLLPATIIAAVVAVVTLAAAPRTAAPPSSLELANAAAAIAQANAVALPLFEKDMEMAAAVHQSLDKDDPLIDHALKEALESARRFGVARTAIKRHAEEAAVLYERAKTGF